MTKASDPAPAPELQALSTEALAEELAHLLRKHSSLSIPDDGDHLDQFWQTKLESIGIGTNDSHALDLMEYSLSPYFDEFRLRFPIEESTSSPGFHLFNGLYMAVDAHIYYALIRHLKPRQIIEIGNGYSIMLSAAACEFNREQHGHETQLVAIDPDPWDIFRNPYPGLSALIPQRVQDVPFERFAALEANDIVFIDPRHIIRRGNDVSYEYLEILPRLNAGVMVHIHGIGLPKTYPKQYYDDAISRGEQYLSQGVLTFNSHFEVVWPSNYMDVTYPDRVAAAFPELRLTRQHYPYFEPTAFWMKVRDPRQSSFAPTGDAGFLQTQTLRCLSQALPARRAGHSDASGTTGREGIADEFPTGQPDAVFGLAQASAGELPSAIAAFGRHLRNFPNDTAVAYRLASCLACCGCLDDADWIFSRRIELPLREDGSTNTEIITLWPGTGPFSDAASVGTLPYRRETAIELAGRATMKGVDLVYFVSCGFDRAKRFFPDLVRSIEAVGGFPVGVHIHIVNPDPECFRAIASLVESSPLPIVMSHENLTWREGNGEFMLEQYYEISGLLMLSRILFFYDRPIVTLDIDQPVAHSPVDLVAAVASHDAALRVFPDKAGDLLALFATSPIIVRATEEGRHFAAAVRNFLLGHILHRRGLLVPRLREAALAVSVLRSTNLNWVTLPPAECPQVPSALPGDRRAGFAVQ